MLFAVLAPPAQSASASVNYTHDTLGRVTTALYDNGTCIIYSYDPVGNRTAQTNTNAAGPRTPTWGVGSWGCFNWTAAELSETPPWTQPIKLALAPMANRQGGAVRWLVSPQDAFLGGVE